MIRVSVLISGSTKTIDLQESIIAINSNPYILVKKATIFWNYVNITSAVNDKIKYNSSDHVFSPGYHTFKMIADDLKKLGSIELVANRYDSTCTITTDHQIELFKFGQLLGFDENTTITTTKTSPNVVNINRGLKYIQVTSNIVNRSKNIVNGNKSDCIAVLPITSTQTLKASVQHFFDIESRIPINKGVINQLEFKITDQDDNSVNVGEVLLDLYIM